ncbi:uncharacterized protein LOC128203628 [Mya arenaria]|uniref:uncharacterized protein LOC128203628 n=1 Tax=Mya arenaria TaxID=6604 RepID=UPI0022DEB142|nr:uncharacterized protein LOC128203628 [Mya arenaria]
MRKHRLSMWFVPVLLATCICCVLGRTCTQTSNCDCGDQCVDSSNMEHCMGGSDCVCKTGCVVVHTFIPAGQEKTVHCNRCSCPTNSAHSNGKPTCSRVAWCNVPPETDIYQDNPNCPNTPFNGHIGG